MNNVEDTVQRLFDAFPFGGLGAYSFEKYFLVLLVSMFVIHTMFYIFAMVRTGDHRFALAIQKDLVWGWALSIGGILLPIALFFIGRACLRCVGILRA